MRAVGGASTRAAGAASIRADEMETLPAPDCDGAVRIVDEAEAISSAFCASSADATDPGRMILSATVRTWMSLPGIAALSKADDSPTSRPTETSMVAIFRRSRANAKMVVSPSRRRKYRPAAPSATNRIGDLGVANVDFAGFLGQVNEHGFAEPIEALAAKSDALLNRMELESAARTIEAGANAEGGDTRRRTSAGTERDRRHDPRRVSGQQATAGERLTGSLLRGTIADDREARLPGAIRVDNRRAGPPLSTRLRSAR